MFWPTSRGSSYVSHRSYIKSYIKSSGCIHGRSFCRYKKDADAKTCKTKGVVKIYRDGPDHLEMWWMQNA